MMDKNPRTMWIVIALLVLLAACCCALIILAAAIGLFSWTSLAEAGLYQERIERTFQVGDEPFLDLSNGAGSITLQKGPSGSIHLEGTKEASSRRALGEIRVLTTPQDGGLVIDSRWPKGTGTSSVDLVLTVPAGTKVALSLGAGAVDVSGLSAPIKIDTGAGDLRIQDVRGELEVKTGAGNVHVSDAQGPAVIKLGAGNLEYEGSPEGDCSFVTGVGTVNLWLPKSLNAEVDLSTALGSVVVEYDVQGQVSKQQVSGTIGSGEDASIHARSSAGEVTVHRR